MNGFCLHTITTRAWSLEECARYYPQVGVKGITVSYEQLPSTSIRESGQRLRDAGLDIVSFCLPACLPHLESAKREEALEDFLWSIEHALELGAPLLVVNGGVDPRQGLEANRAQITDGLHRLLPDLQAAGLKLALEPCHPMGAGESSAINTLAQAHDICDQLGSPESLGIAIDLHHVWWDSTLKQQIRLAGEKGRLAAFHVSDWMIPTRHLSEDRGLMGEGCIPIREIQTWLQAAGFRGPNEVEIRSAFHRQKDPWSWLQEIAQSYRLHVAA